MSDAGISAGYRRGSPGYSGFCAGGDKGVSLIIVMIMMASFVIFVAGLGGLIANHAVTGQGLEDAAHYAHYSEGLLMQSLSEFLHDNRLDGQSREVELRWRSVESNVRIDTCEIEPDYNRGWEISAAIADNRGVARTTSLNIQLADAPVFSEQYHELPGTPVDMVIYGDRAYVAIEAVEAADTGLYIFHVSTDGTLDTMEIGSFTGPIERVRGIAVHSCGLAVDVYLAGTINGEAGIARIDVSDPFMPVAPADNDVVDAAEFGGAELAFKPYVYNNHDSQEIWLYVALGEHGIGRISLSATDLDCPDHFSGADPDWPPASPVFDWPDECYAAQRLWDNTLLIAAGADGLSRIDLNTGAVLDTYELELGVALDVAVRYNIAMVAAGEGGLRALDLNTKTEIIMPAIPVAEGIFLDWKSAYNQEIIWVAGPAGLTKLNRAMRTVWAGTGR